MTAAGRLPVHVEVLLPEDMWESLHAVAARRGSTIAGEIAEALVAHLHHRAPEISPLVVLEDELRRARRAGYRTPGHRTHRKATA